MATIARDPENLTARTAIVDLVDKVAMNAADPAGFRHWAGEILPETDRLEAEGDRAFIRQRIHDWPCYLSIKDGQVPAPEELAEVTDWTQRILAEESVSRPVLALLAESGRTKKIRNIARNRAGNRDPG